MPALLFQSITRFQSNNVLLVNSSLSWVLPREGRSAGLKGYTFLLRNNRDYKR